MNGVVPVHECFLSCGRRIQRIQERVVYVFSSEISIRVDSVPEDASFGEESFIGKVEAQVGLEGAIVNQTRLQLVKARPHMMDIPKGKL
jgi:hypothetical protein